VSAIGAELLRREDLPLLTGSSCFVADVERAGQLYARVVRSQVAHGLLRGVDAEAAREHSAVVAVFTAADLPDIRIPIRLPFAETPEANRALQPPLAVDRVRYVGEPIALVVATDPYAVEDAAELVFADVDELDPAVDLTEAAEAGAPILHPALGTNVVNRIPMSSGDVDAAFAEADVVVRERLVVHRHTAAPMETRGLVAEWDESAGRLTVWGAAKVKHFNRAVLARLLELPPESVRLVEVDVGGGFGVRGEFYPEDFLVPFAAVALRRPVKWIEDRLEHLVATNHAREQVHEIEVAARADGTLLAFRDRAWCDQGAYVRTQGLMPPVLSATSLPGPYRWRTFSIEAAGVLTNRTPVGTYRAPGVAEAGFVRERMVDLVARELGLDPAEVRRKSLVPSGEMPFTFDLGPGPPPLVYESGDYPGTFDRLLDEAGYERLLAERTRRRAAGELVGIGLSAFVEPGGVGPFERAAIAPTAAGEFVVSVASSSLGQGIRTSLAQIAADALGVPFERVQVRHHDTDEIPEGFGAFASRTTVLCGNAIVVAARDLRAKAAELADTPPDGVDLGAQAALLAERGVEGLGTFEKEGLSFSFGANLAVAAVDAETGKVSIERYVVAFDVGRAINPALVRGQLVGAAVQGIAGALLERLDYDELGQPLSTSFVDYLLPTADDVPDVDVIVVEHPTPANPLGIKGAGEGGIAGTLGAVANAVDDALHETGVRVTRLPLTPAAVRALLVEAGNA
jgi:aerobic carbon-monoxide dehydrogenase large subunit